LRQCFAKKRYLSDLAVIPPPYGGIKKTDVAYNYIFRLSLAKGVNHPGKIEPTGEYWVDTRTPPTPFHNWIEISFLIKMFGEAGLSRKTYIMVQRYVGSQKELI
jgi:hypothetical protein